MRCKVDHLYAISNRKTEASIYATTYTRASNVGHSQTPQSIYLCYVYMHVLFSIITTLLVMVIINNIP